MSHLLIGLEIPYLQKKWVKDVKDNFNSPSLVPPGQIIDWYDPEQLHITLVQIGDVQNNKIISNLEDKLSHIKLPPISIKFGDLKLIEGKYKNHLVIEVVNIEEIFQIQKSISKKLQGPKKNIPTPHLSIAKLSKETTLHFKHARSTIIPYTAREFNLYTHVTIKDHDYFQFLNSYELKRKRIGH